MLFQEEHCFAFDCFVYKHLLYFDTYLLGPFSFISWIICGKYIDIVLPGLFVDLIEKVVIADYQLR